MQETFELSLEGGWGESNAGGRRKIGGKNNSSWCRNQQYFLNVTQPTQLKVRRPARSSLIDYPEEDRAREEDARH